MFQSSPVPKDGCNPGNHGEVRVRNRFNPHPSRRTGATCCCWQAALRWHSFNPHPSRRTGATPGIGKRPKVGAEFQSSPVPKDGCNHRVIAIGELRQGFNPHPSRRTGATQRAKERCFTKTLFQSSPVPKDGCNPGRNLAGSQPERFNPHPSRRTGATFDPEVEREKRELVSILTRPEGRVQLQVVRDPL